MNHVAAAEINFDGLIGPTHNYSGLSPGNLASTHHAQQMSYPRAAALQGLAKMRCLVSLGYRQGILPPQIRPDLSVLRNLGFSGSENDIINSAARLAPELLTMVYSASSMWAANAATVTPSADTADQKVHFTVANLLNTAHRSIEARQTGQCLRAIFSDAQHFVVHDELEHFGDEGAANHNRLCRSYGEPGMAMFVYGRVSQTPGKFPARQTLVASQAVARQHGILEKSVFVQQNPAAIDAGAFHNDVVAVANGPVLFHHERAFIEDQITSAADKLNDAMPLLRIIVTEREVSLKDAISSYLFNSQLMAAADGRLQQMRLIAPFECRDTASVKQYLDRLICDSSQPIREVNFVDVRQSMSNGGGPACLRLRVVLNEAEQNAVNARFLLDENKIDLLETWVNTHYRETLVPADLADPQLKSESYAALDALQALLGLGSYYSL